ncbi:LysR family transcriptional regulator [Verticiella sediminum]|uniref:LysR family transcriptional regulator n=1 Tax=Verticiella sediminum TaxID=1247510 RepID=A0A556ABY1_9BURK|nr:LysR family transcriptional regulator [Verticiella sediminum]TSH90391.1 LysR family transcriptional regulator [Verticiella sediminum]
MDSLSDLSFFALLMKHGSLTSAAQELGVTPPSVSKRLAALEARLGVRLLNRTTRRISLTPEGETYLTEGAKVLDALDAVERAVSGATLVPRGLLKISATLGFGRRFIAPALSDFSRAFPDIEVQLHLTDRPVNLVEQAFDVSVRIGTLPDARLTARKLASNKRVLCAAPAYLAKAGTPTHPRELPQHNCLFIREGDEAFGSWHLQSGGRQETVKIRGTLSSNDGECALAWALDGHGILLRSQWDIAPHLRSGRLQQVLPNWEPPAADIYLVFLTKAHMSAKTRALVDFLYERFGPYRIRGGEQTPPW